FGLVDAMAEAGDLLPRGEHVLHILDRVCAFFIDGEQKAHHAFVRTPMQGALQSANRAGNCGVNVGEGGGDDAGREGGGVQFVVGVKNEGEIESSSGRFRGFNAIQHPEKIAGVGKGAVGRNNFLTLSNAIVDGYDHGNLGGKVIGLADVRVVGVVLFVGVVEAERRHRGSQNLHGSRAGGEAAKQIDDALIEDAGKGKLGLKFAQLKLVGQAAVPQQEGG